MKFDGLKRNMYSTSNNVSVHTKRMVNYLLNRPNSREYFVSNRDAVKKFIIKSESYDYIGEPQLGIDSIYNILDNI